MIHDVQVHPTRAGTERGSRIRNASLEILFVLGCLFALSACSRPINRAAERRIREALPDLLGPARRYQVHVSGAPLDTTAGKLAAVIIDADDVQLPNGMLLDHLNLDLRKVDYDLDHRHLRRVASAAFRIDVGQATLDEYLAGEMPRGETVRHVRVSLRSLDQVAISGERIALGVGVPFQLTGPLRIAGPTRIAFDPKGLALVGVPIPGLIVDFFKDYLVRAVDLSHLPFRVRLSAIHVDAGRLSLLGAADTDALIYRSAR